MRQRGRPPFRAGVSSLKNRLIARAHVLRPLLSFSSRSGSAFADRRPFRTNQAAVEEAELSDLISLNDTWPGSVPNRLASPDLLLDGIGRRRLASTPKTEASAQVFPLLLTTQCHW